MYNWLVKRKWTAEMANEWQKFYHEAPRMFFSGRSSDFHIETIAKIPQYEDLKAETCNIGQRQYWFSWSALLFPFLMINIFG